MVRTSTGVYSDIRYKELLDQQAKESEKSRWSAVSDYFGLVTLSDKIWFYGSHGFCLGVLMFIMVLNVL
ncbi:DUF3961 domain-containing protein [Bacillus subtilis]|uniref:DUF3961 domain-containing protein n=1 Tax=Bacillus subtilis TaxID=1423 RepID=UPI0013D1E2C7|nr:DUF3961 domain-containing protein [Bacillus subtilis]NRF01928.1 DUF3961 domain-containing protein [Bacillus subtilis]NRG37166.1 DUF3961 domain-containing protein [Bacillus subtilis]WHX51869.1 DUF3961 domain-containing protein [Bacillus subtilis]WHX55871.1 DUF3961 domain-containing protein [Bacillus subtilis]WHX94210.1 DUF3961 domain-containing protein [Bacillus subtilis]